jgi:hypothetical protein
MVGYTGVELPQAFDDCKPWVAKRLAATAMKITTPPARGRLLVFFMVSASLAFGKCEFEASEAGAVAESVANSLDQKPEQRCGLRTPNQMLTGPYRRCTAAWTGKLSTRFGAYGGD